MELKEFLAKNELTMEPENLASAEKALDRMAKSYDVLHDKNHCLRMFDLLDEFLASEKGVSKILINFDVLLLAISWHDTWKATRRGKGFFDWFFSLYYDGFGSAKIFARHNKNLEPNIYKQTYYAVRRHGPPAPLVFKTLEIRILRDVDGLEEWSVSRLAGLVNQYQNNRTAIHRLGRWLKIYFHLALLRQKENKYFFTWSREEFYRRRKIYIEMVNQLLKQYGL